MIKSLTTVYSLENFDEKNPFRRFPVAPFACGAQFDIELAIAGHLVGREAHLHHQLDRLKFVLQRISTSF